MKLEDSISGKFHFHLKINVLFKIEYHQVHYQLVAL